MAVLLLVSIWLNAPPQMVHRSTEHSRQDTSFGGTKFDAIPKVVSIGNIEHKVIGISHGVKPPFVSLEIEKTNKNVIGKEIVA